MGTSQSSMTDVKESRRGEQAIDADGGKQIPAGAGENRVRGRGMALLGLLVLVGLAVRVIVLWHNPYIGVGDHGTYVHMAEDILEGHGIGSLSFPPGFPAMIALVGRLGVEPALAGKLVDLVLGTMLIPLVWLIAARMYGAPAAWYAGLLIVFHPVLIRRSTDGMSAGAFLLFLWLAIGLLLYSLDDSRGRRSVGWWISAAVAFGAAYLTRREGLVYCAVALPAFAAAQRVGDVSWRRVSVSVATVAGGVAVFVIPYTIFIHSQTGQWMPWGISGEIAVHGAMGQDQGGLAFEDKRYGMDDGAAMPGSEAVAQAKAGSKLRLFAERPGFWIRHYLHNFYYECTQVSSPVGISAGRRQCAAGASTYLR